MKRRRRTKSGAGIVTIMLAVLLCMPLVALAGSLEPSGPPGPTMKTLQEVYDKAEKAEVLYNAFSKTPAEVCAGVKFMGLREDGTIGEQTGTKDCSPSVTTTTTAIVTTTTTTAASGQRFTDNGDGTVTDTRTGLVWLKNANPCGIKNWSNAGTYCSSLASGMAGLTDGSTAGQWRLPSKEELEGIGTDPPATWESGYPSVTWTMPGTPFTNVNSYNYWSSTTRADGTDRVWIVRMDSGGVSSDYKSSRYSYYVWPVRSGQ